VSATVIPRRRGRPPKLKVIGGPARPRHRVVFAPDRFVSFSAVEFWSEAEWAALAEWERPDPALWLPGIGYLAQSTVTGETADEIQECWEATVEAARFLRGRED